MSYDYTSQKSIMYRMRIPTDILDSRRACRSEYNIWPIINGVKVQPAVIQASGCSSVKTPLS